MPGPAPDGRLLRWNCSRRADLHRNHGGRVPGSRQALASPNALRRARRSTVQSRGLLHTTQCADRRGDAAICPRRNASPSSTTMATRLCGSPTCFAVIRDRIAYIGSVATRRAPARFRTAPPAVTRRRAAIESATRTLTAVRSSGTTDVPSEPWDRTAARFSRPLTTIASARCPDRVRS